MTTEDYFSLILAELETANQLKRCELKLQAAEIMIAHPTTPEAHTRALNIASAILTRHSDA